ncbi:MAG: SusF/SusE family outer membrane protein [Muribaculaceae bacterium]|nr:SusF/SusE family outer membrane protein [Muribaculaceae bacterium]
MKFNNIISCLSALLVLLGLASCDSEKDLVIIEGNLPIKTSTLYMLGDATPTGWSNTNPTPLEPTAEEPLLFTWEGPLNTGELKLCLVPGSWDVPFIRPLSGGTPIDKNGIADAEFKMNAGNPDDKWNVTDAGIYFLSFDLRNWTMSAEYIGALPGPVIEPIEAEAVYMVGDFNGWNIAEPTELEKKSDYIYTYEGPMDAGEMKACISKGSWDVPFIRPQAGGCKIGRNGVESDSFVYTTGPDNKWQIEEPGIYRITFDLENWTIAAEYTGEYKPASKLYMIGSATEGGWSWDAAIEIVAEADDDNIFVWEGELGRGTFKASKVKDFGKPFYRPSTADCEVSDKGVAANDMVFTDSPDDQWLVTVAGKYRIRFNLTDMTIAAEYLDGGTVSASPLYMIGSATAGGWSLDDATELSPVDGAEGEYTWTGELKEGTFKACSERDFSAPFYRPSSAGCTVSESGVSATDMVYTTDPDDQWNVVTAGRYEITLNIKAMTIAVKYLGASEAVAPLYMIGTATAGGWSLDDATELSPVAGVEGEYTWTGTLKEGIFKACSERDFSAPFYRPSSADCKISAEGITATDMVYTTGPDDQWQVVTEGRYELTLNIKSMTINAKYLD